MTAKWNILCIALAAAAMGLTGCGGPQEIPLPAPSSSISPSAPDLPSKGKMPLPDGEASSQDLTAAGTPGEAVLGCMEAFRSLDLKALAQYAPSDTDASIFEQEIDFDSSEGELLRLLFQGAEFQVTGAIVSANGNTAIVTLTITNVDIQAAMEDAQSEVFLWALEQASAASGETPSDEEIEEKILEILAGTIKTCGKQVKETVTLSLIQEDGRWILPSLPHELLSALTGGLDLGE